MTLSLACLYYCITVYQKSGAKVSMNPTIQDVAFLDSILDKSTLILSSGLATLLSSFNAVVRVLRDAIEMGHTEL